MKKLILFGAAISISVAISAQHVALKNNLLYDATTTPNLALEIGLGKKTTLDLYGGYNPFTLGGTSVSSIGWYSRNFVIGPANVSMEPFGDYTCMGVNLAWPVSICLLRCFLHSKIIVMKGISMEEASVWDISGC